MTDDQGTRREPDSKPEVEDSPGSDAQEGEPSSPLLAQCEMDPAGLYCIYEVVDGDTLSGVAEKFDLAGTDSVTPWQLIVESNRPELVSETDVLQVGAKLRIPTSTGLIHVVHTAETLSELAVQFDVNAADIQSVNGMGTEDVLQVGQEVLIPRPNRLSYPEAPASAESEASVDAEVPELRTGSDPDSGATQVQATSPAGFMWPASGPISSYYGASHPLGLDIDLAAAPGSSNLAAAAGTVTFAGGNPCCSYGYYVIVDHGNGVQTLYAHFSSLSVTAGEQVVQGQPLGTAGSTGYSTGTHLHFEVLEDGAPVDPSAYLP